MALPVIASVYRCAFNWTNDLVPGLAATNVMHFKKTGSDALTVAGIIESHMNSGLLAHTSQHSAITSVDVTPLDGSTLTLPYKPVTAANWDGGVTSTSILPQVACVIKLRTQKRGRSFRGRVFLPWVCEEAVIQGKIEASNVANMTTAWTTFLAAMGSDSCNLGVASYLHSTFEPVVLATCENFTGTQRRRNARTSV